MKRIPKHEHPKYAFGYNLKNHSHAWTAIFAVVTVISILSLGLFKIPDMNAKILALEKNLTEALEAREWIKENSEIKRPILDGRSFFGNWVSIHCWYDYNLSIEKCETAYDIHVFKGTNISTERFFK